MGLALALPSNYKNWLERVSKVKPSSLLGLIISDEEKKVLLQVIDPKLLAVFDARELELVSTFLQNFFFSCCQIRGKIS